MVTKTSGLSKTFNDIRKCSLYYFEQKKENIRLYTTSTFKYVCVYVYLCTGLFIHIYNFFENVHLYLNCWEEIKQNV